MSAMSTYTGTCNYIMFHSGLMGEIGEQHVAVFGLLSACRVDILDVFRCTANEHIPLGWHLHIVWSALDVCLAVLWGPFLLLKSYTGGMQMNSLSVESGAGALQEKSAVFTSFTS